MDPGCRATAQLRVQSYMTIPRSFAGDAGHARVGPLLPLRSILAEAGISADAVFGRIGVSPDVFDHPDNRISFEVAGQLIETSAQLARLPDLGLRLGSAGNWRTLVWLANLFVQRQRWGRGFGHSLNALLSQDSGGVLMLLPKIPHADGHRLFDTYGRYPSQKSDTGHGGGARMQDSQGALRACLGASIQFPHARGANLGPLGASKCSNMRFDAEVARNRISGKLAGSAASR